LALIDTIKRRRVNKNIKSDIPELFLGLEQFYVLIVGGIVTFSEGIRWIISIDTL